MRMTHPVFFCIDDIDNRSYNVDEGYIDNR